MKSHLILAALAGVASALHGFTFSPEDFPAFWNVGGDLNPVLEGAVFYAYEKPPPASPADTETLYELWNSGTNELFYTASAAEIASLHLLSGVGINQVGWQYATDFINCFPSQGTDAARVQLGRYYNGNDHFYTTNPAEAAAAGYIFELVACWVYATAINGAVPVYRWKA